MLEKGGASTRISKFVTPQKKRSAAFLMLADAHTGSLLSTPRPTEQKYGSEYVMNNQKKNSMITALMLVLMAGSTGVGADGSDPLDPSDGGADWDGDGLTNAEELSLIHI